MAIRQPSIQSRNTQRIFARPGKPALRKAQPPRLGNQIGL